MSRIATRKNPVNDMVTDTQVTAAPVMNPMDTTPPFDPETPVIRLSGESEPLPDHIRSREILTLMLRYPATLGHLCGFPALTEELHGKWMRQMLSGEGDLTIMAHRGSYKTTCLSLVIATLLVLSPEKNILFLRKTDADVSEMLRQVRHILEDEAFQAMTGFLLGQPVKVTRGTGSELSTNLWNSPRGAVQLLGQGIGSSLTGKHADLIFTDDIVNMSDRDSRAERQFTCSVFQELQNIRNPGGRIISTCTPWHPADATSLMQNVQRYDCYTTGLVPPERIEALRASMDAPTFAANWELKHIPSGDVMFSTTPPFTPDESLLEGGIAQLDAAYGGGDCTALTCASLRDGKYCLYGRVWRRRVDDVLDEVVMECTRLGVTYLYCESNGDRGFLARDLRERGLMVRTYTEHQQKFMKIATYLRRAWKDVVLLRGTDPAYIRQILSFAEGVDHDDAPDSAASAVRVLMKRGG